MQRLGTRVETCACLGRIKQLENGPAPELCACEKGAQNNFLGGAVCKQRNAVHFFR